MYINTNIKIVHKVKVCHSYRCFIAGVIYDRTGSFSEVFLLNGSAYIVAGTSYASIIYLNRWRPKWCFPHSDKDDRIALQSEDELGQARENASSL